MLDAVKLYVNSFPQLQNDPPHPQNDHLLLLIKMLGMYMTQAILYDYVKNIFNCLQFKTENNTHCQVTIN